LADPEDPQLYVVSEALLRDLEEYGIEKLEKVGLKVGRDGTTEITPLDMRNIEKTFTTWCKSYSAR
jgi:hypothetical protein